MNAALTSTVPPASRCAALRQRSTRPRCSGPRWSPRAAPHGRSWLVGTARPTRRAWPTGPAVALAPTAKTGATQQTRATWPTWAAESAAPACRAPACDHEPVFKRSWARAALSHFAFTGISRHHLGQVMADLAGPWQARREAGLQERRRPGPPRARGAGDPRGPGFPDRGRVALAGLGVAGPAGVRAAGAPPPGPAARRGRGAPA